MKTKYIVIWLAFFGCFGGLTTTRAQENSGRFDFYLEANLGPVFNKNAEETTFEPVVTTSFGAQFITRYSFSKLGISTGLGIGKLNFSERLRLAPTPEQTSSSTTKIGYLIFNIPILMHYSLTDRFEIYGGVNILTAAWQSYGFGVGSNGNSRVETQTNEDIPEWQFTQEAVVGLDYKISKRLELGVSVAKSLRNIEGMDIEMDISAPGQANMHVSSKFDYSWTRVNFEVAYRLNK